MEAPFHDRQRELATLQLSLDETRGQLFILYGRRGVGKSALLAQVTSRVRHVYYRASRRALPLQLAELTETVRETYADAFVPNVFGSAGECLEFLSSYARGHEREQVVVVIDELPYLADVDAGLITVIQHWWDANKRLPNLKIFLSGSYVSFMEREVLGSNAPLYNRRTGAMRLEPMSYREAAEFFPRYSARERIEAWAILGGLPSYLEQFDPGQTIDENLLATALRPNTYLNQEPEWLLLEDLRSDITYGSILHAIAGGERRPSGIARAIGKQSAQDVTRQLDGLRELLLVERQVPVTDLGRPTSRRSQYWLADNYLAFWYRYASPLGSLIVQGRGDLALSRIHPTFHEFVARPPWEKACRQFLISGGAPGDVQLTEIGPWWDDRSEIDIIGLDGNRAALAGSCKWSHAQMDTRDLHELQQAVENARQELRPRDDIWWALFSREGFHSSLLALAAQPHERILLCTPVDLFEDTSG